MSDEGFSETTASQSSGVALAGSSVGVRFHDFNVPTDEDGLYYLVLTSRYYHGLLPRIGDRVTLADPDPSCGSEEAVVERLSGNMAYARPVPGTFRYWKDQEPVATTGSLPDWLAEAYALRGKPWPDFSTQESAQASDSEEGLSASQDFQR